MITSAKWQLGKGTLNIVLASGEQRSCGLERDNDPASIGDGPSRELVMAFLAQNGTISEPDAPLPPPAPEPDAKAILKALVKKGLITEADARNEMEQ